MSEIKTRFPIAKVPSRFPVPKEANPDKLSSWPLQEDVTRKKTKEEVNFQSPAKGKDNCLNCVKFDAPNACYGVVPGIIDARDWCNQFVQIKGIGYPISKKDVMKLPYSEE